jgi:hypothetical protein
MRTIAGLVFLLAAAISQSAPADQELLARVGQYVQELEERLAVTIGDET